MFNYRCVLSTVFFLPILITHLISPVYAQVPNGIITPGDAAVTAFAGINNPANGNALFNLNGPSMRVISLPASNTFGLKNAAKRFTVTAHHVGQVFGIALDDQPQPNIYVAATSAYGLALYKPGTGRVKRGAPGAQYMPGQFGPADQGGGPGSIWRIDGKSGKVTLFANVIYQGIENTPAALGGLAFDAKNQQLFVADRATGIIHRFAMDGTDLGVFDHGVQGLAATGQPEVAFDPATLANIKSPSFDTENYKTWGYAPAERRVFALAVHNHRLYYSVAGSHIWSVGIGSNGSFSNDARFETDVPALKTDTEISSMAFDNEGLMYVAERAAPTGEYEFIKVALGGENRVKRFAPKKSDDGSPGLWTTPSEQYAIGMLPNYQNADGGVDLNCEQIVWATGEHLLDPDKASSEPFPHIDGLQGTAKKLVEPANMPPQQSWYINYYDTEAHPDSSGHMGALVILKVCGDNVPPQPPVGLECPPGTFLIDCKCVIPPICPPGTIFRDGYCIFEDCPWGFVKIDNTCVKQPIDCGLGSVYINDRCTPVECPPNLEYGTNGYCRCPKDFLYDRGQCVPPPVCPPGEHFQDGRCIPDCPPGQWFINCKCVPKCPRDEQYIDGRCVPPCPPDERYINGRCSPLCPRYERYINGRCVPPCLRNERYINGRCVPPSCPPNERYINGRCVPPPCPPNERYINGRCVPPLCSRNERYINGKCVPTCPRNQRYINGRCVPPLCSPNEHYINGRCIPRRPCKTTEVLRNGRCVPIINPVCKPDEKLYNGRCIPIRTTPRCLKGQIMRNGQCITPNKPPKPLCPRGQYYRQGRCVSPGSNITPPQTGGTIRGINQRYNKPVSGQ